MKKYIIINFLPLFILTFLFSFDVCLAQNRWIQIVSNEYDQLYYNEFNSKVNVMGNYQFTISKSSGIFEPGQFTINISLPYGAVFGGGETIPKEFAITKGDQDSSSVVISIVKQWSGGLDERSFSLPVKIIAPAEDQPTYTTIQWMDAFTQSEYNGSVALLNIKGEPELRKSNNSYKIDSKTEPVVMYPNPVKSLLKINRDTSGELVSGRVQILNNAGKIIFYSESIPTEGIDTSKLSPGIYLVKITGQDGLSTTREIVKE